jgi:hypothetical protein
VVERSDTTGSPHPPNDPGGVAAPTTAAVRLLKISVIIFNFGLGQHVEEFISGCARTMMLLLIRDVLLNRLPRGSAHRKCRIAFLPGKGPQADLLLHPFRGSLFQLAQNVRQAMSRFQTDQKVDVIGHTADALWKSAEAGDGPSQILVQPRTPFRRDDGFAMSLRSTTG